MQYRKRMLRKKGTALLLSALLLASALPLAAYAEEVSAKTTEYVNFRSGPGTNYSSQGIIASGTTITVTDTSNSEWYAVRLSNALQVIFTPSIFPCLPAAAQATGKNAVPNDGICKFPLRPGHKLQL